MQIGGMNHPARSPVKEIDWFGAHGFDFVDLTLEPPASDPAEINVSAVKRALSRHGLDVVTHTAWYIPISLPYARFRTAALDEFRRCLEITVKLGAAVMNTHFTAPPPLMPEDQTVDRHVEVLAPLCEEAARCNVSIVLEHVPRGGRNQLETILAIMQEIPRLRFHLDSGHAKLERDTDRWGEYLKHLGDRLLHVHLSDNDGTSDQHLPLGASPRSLTRWPAHIKKLKATGYDGTITLEVFAPEREYLLVSRDLLRRWWDAA